jgi:hypothetical protein
MHRHHISRLSDRIARLEVRATLIPFTGRRDKQLTYIGFADHPAYCLECPFSPDDPWAIYHEPDPRFVADDSPSPPIDEFLTGTSAQRGRALFDHLPPGDYQIIKSPRRPKPTETLLMGNEAVPAGPFVRLLYRGDGLYAAVIGAHAEQAPALDQPLLALPILNFARGMVGLLCVEIAAPASDPAPKEPEGDLVIVVPETGPLVQNTLREFGATEDARARQRWSETGAPAAAARLASSGA